LKKSGYSVTVACSASSVKEWFDSTLPLSIGIIRPEVANRFRRINLKGFVKYGSCNLYIGLFIGKQMIGVMGFQNPSYGNYDILMKADTTPSYLEKSTDLLLFALRSKEVQNILEGKFGRKIETIMSTCFSEHEQIARYRKHGELVNKTKESDGFHLSYIFKSGSIISLKEAKAQFIQKSCK